MREQPTRHALLILQCPHSLIFASRRAAIEQFKSDMYGRDNQDISVLNEAIEKAPIVSKEDALAPSSISFAKRPWRRSST